MFERIHSDIKQRLFFKFFYGFVRISMSLTFILSGIRKVPGIKFTMIPIEDPIGFFFEAMYQTGFYWNFIGYYQIIVGIMILFNRLVAMSVLLMMPVTVNIFLISIALEMQGTPLITSAMLLANIFLMVWHFNNYKTIFQKPL